MKLFHIYDPTCIFRFLLISKHIFVLQENKPQSPSQARKLREAPADSTKDGMAYNCLLKNELLGAGIDDLKDQTPDERKILVPKDSKNMFHVSEIGTFAYHFQFIQISGFADYLGLIILDDY